MSVRELKAALTELGVDFSLCVEKRELQALLALHTGGAEEQKAAEEPGEPPEAPFEPETELQIGDVAVRVIQDERSGNKATHTLLWPASRALAAYLLEHVPLEGRSVVELGAGTGLVGAVAHLRGASRVVLTDLETSLLERNADANRRADCGDLQVRRHAWGEPVAPLSPPFDLVLASDVVYNSELFPPLIASLEALCQASPGCQTLLAYVRRHSSEEWFFSELRDRFSEVRLVHTAAGGEQIYSIALYPSSGG